MQWLFDAGRELAAPYLGVVGALLLMVVLVSAGAGLAIGGSWIVFRRGFSAVTGRPFVFTRRMAFTSSAALAAVLSCIFVAKVIESVISGEFTSYHHGVSQVDFWQSDRGAFMLDICELALRLGAVWAFVSALLIKAAARPTDAFAQEKISKTPPRR